MLPHTFLKLCLEAYLGKEELRPDIDPLLSPSLASDEILSAYPRTRIVVGTNDSLHDESWRLAQKLNRLKKDYYMIVYRGMPHGFLSLDGTMREAKPTVEDAC